MAFLLLSVGVAFAEPASSEGREDLSTMSVDEVSRRLENPLTDLWSLTFQQNLALVEGDRIEGTEIQNTFFFQPALPIPLGKDKVFIARPVFPIVTNPVLDPSQPDGVDGHKTGFGDIQMLALVGPNRRDGTVACVKGTPGTFLWKYCQS